MVVPLVDVADNIIVHQGVFTGSEVPRLLLGVIRAVLQTLQLVVEVQNVVSLLVTQGAVLNATQASLEILRLGICDIVIKLTLF